jgi:hypothetical protein
MAFHFFGTPFAHRLRYNIAKLAIPRPGLADAGSVTLFAPSPVFQYLRLDGTSPEPGAFIDTDPACILHIIDKIVDTLQIQS